jgi:hypothetical protein
MKQLVICTHKREKKIKVNNILFIAYALGHIVTDAKIARNVNVLQCPS